jgi:hypothetical protein
MIFSRFFKSLPYQRPAVESVGASAGISQMAGLLELRD